MKRATLTDLASGEEYFLHELLETSPIDEISIGAHEDSTVVLPSHRGQQGRVSIRFDHEMERYNFKSESGFFRLTRQGENFCYKKGESIGLEDSDKIGFLNSTLQYAEHETHIIKRVAEGILSHVPLLV